MAHSQEIERSEPEKITLNQLNSVLAANVMNDEWTASRLSEQYKLKIDDAGTVFELFV